MPGNYLNIDTELPTFSGQESEKEMVQGMMNYITQLVDQLRYTLMNLDQSNFNAKALDEISTGSASSIADQIQTLTNQLNQTNTDVSNLKTRMQTAEGNINGLGDDVAELQGVVQIDEDTGDITIGDGTAQVDINGGTVNINATDIGDLADDVSDLTGAVQVDANGDITIGGTGVQVDINGDVNINGTPQ